MAGDLCANVAADRDLWAKQISVAAEREMGTAKIHFRRLWSVFLVISLLFPVGALRGAQQLGRSMAFSKGKRTDT